MGIFCQKHFTCAMFHFYFRPTALDTILGEIIYNSLIFTSCFYDFFPCIFYLSLPLFHLQKPTFAPDTPIDELGQFLQNCRDVPHLDLFSGENSMDITAAMV